MIDLSETTVRHLLPGQLSNITQVLNEKLHEELRGKALPNVLDDAIADRVTQAVTGVLDIDVLSILAGGWAKAGEIRQYRTPDPKLPTGAVTELFLGEHDLSAELHPVVTLSFTKVAAIRIPFVLSLIAHIRFAKLTIRETRIIEVGQTDASVKAQLNLGAFPLHKPLESSECTLVKGHKLKDPGIAIP
jgi:hypothetical protein